MKAMLIAMSLLALAQPAAAAGSCAKEGDDAPLSLHKAWILTGWERKEGEAPFVFAEKMKRYYDLASPRGVFYDNFAPGETQLFDNAATYGANWEGLQNGARSVLHGLTQGHDQLVGEDVASTTVGFVGQLTRLDGEVLAFDARSQLGWACTADGWKIRHEMNYAWPVEPETVAPFLQKTGSSQ